MACLITCGADSDHRFLMVILLVICYSSFVWGRCPKQLDICRCSDHVVRCIGTKFQTESGNAALKAIPANTTKVIFTKNNVSELDPNIFGTPEKFTRQMLTYVNLSGNDIRTIHGKTFHVVSNVTYLDLSENNWLVEHTHSRVFTNFKRLKILKLDNTFTDWVNSSFHTTNLSWIFEMGAGIGLAELEELYLRRNKIWYYPRETFKSLIRLKKLYLSDNVLKNPDISHSYLRNLEELYLNNNSIETPSKNLTKNLDMLSRYHRLRLVNISDNPYRCDCKLIEFVKWLRETELNVTGKDHLQCKWPEDIRGKKLLSLSRDDMVCVPTTPDDLNGALTPFYVVVIVIFSVLAILLIALVVMNRRKLYVHLGRMSSRMSFSRSKFDYSSVNI